MGRTKQDIRIVCAPFTHITLPSYDVSAIKALLSANGLVSLVDVLYMDFAVELGGAVYSILHQTVLGDAVFAALLFPENACGIKTSYADEIRKHNLDFDGIMEKVQGITSRYLEGKTFLPNDYVLFHLYSKQLFPALYIAKRIYEKAGCHIWFSGYHCQDECGQSLRSLFAYVEKTFGKDIEFSIMEALIRVMSRDRVSASLEQTMPTPDYTDFASALAGVSEKFRNEHVAHHWYQVEFTRGCPWNRCSFCTLNCQYPAFTQRSIDRIVQDYATLQNQFNSTELLVTSRNCNSNWKELIEALDREFPGMKGTYDFSFRVENLLHEEDVRFLKEHEIRILVGVESLSRDCIALIDKGQSVIQSIQMLKYVERHGVICYYNLMCALPLDAFEDIAKAMQPEAFK